MKKFSWKILMRQLIPSILVSQKKDRKNWFSWWDIWKRIRIWYEGKTARGPISDLHEILSAKWKTGLEYAAYIDHKFLAYFPSQYTGNLFSAAARSRARLHHLTYWSILIDNTRLWWRSKKARKTRPRGCGLWRCRTLLPPPFPFPLPSEKL